MLTKKYDNVLYERKLILAEVIYKCNICYKSLPNFTRQWMLRARMTFHSIAKRDLVYLEY